MSYNRLLFHMKSGKVATVEGEGDKFMPKDDAAKEIWDSDLFTKFERVWMKNVIINLHEVEFLEVVEVADE